MHVIELCFDIVVAVLPADIINGKLTHKNLNMISNYTPTQVSGKMAAETGGFRRRFKPPFSQDAKRR
jgi:hypothetical protein